MSLQDNKWWRKMLIVLFVVWAAGSTYWYTCQIKYLCEAVAEKTVVDSGKIWNQIKAEPLTVYFGPDSDNILTAGVDEKLQAIVSYMKENKAAKIAITGHTNYHRDTNYTEKLGKQRAEKLKELLVSYGAPAASVSTETKGQRETVAPYSNKDAANLNRRSVISIIN
jgi:outer membrane protein OmpA-like peptidoglycan-associated protein